MGPESNQPTPPPNERLTFDIANTVSHPDQISPKADDEITPLVGTPPVDEVKLDKENNSEE